MTKGFYASPFFNHTMNVLLIDNCPIFKTFHESGQEESLTVIVDDLQSNSYS